jgi:hypothetical protein
MTMRFVALALSLTACIGSASELGTGDDRDDPSPGATPFACITADDCVPAGATYCDCPTFALPVEDPKALACEAVDCQNDTSTCATNVEPACDNNQCVLACKPLECLQCPDGYIAEINGCLSCTCAEPVSVMPDCTVDADCTRVREDCCGCDNGGEDTAVPVSMAGAFDQSLMCPSAPACPGQDNLSEPTCDASFAPRCVRGSCALLDAAMPANACGRADLPECPAGQTCQINVDPAASQYGLGICL